MGREICLLEFDNDLYLFRRKKIPDSKKSGLSGMSRKAIRKILADSRLICNADDSTYVEPLDYTPINPESVKDMLIEENHAMAGMSWDERSKFNLFDDPTPPVITHEQLFYIWGNPVEYWYLSALNFYLKKYKLTTKIRLSFFLANVSVECGHGQYLEEIASGMNYDPGVNTRKAKRVGNSQIGDGPKYKGGGIIQLTGRYNYQQLSDYIDDPNVMEGVTYVANKYPIFSAFVFWEKNKGNQLCDKGATFKEVVYMINGGLTHIAEREMYLKKCEEILR